VPPLSAGEQQALAAHVARQGAVLVPLEITSEGVVLDGHARLRAALELPLALVPVRIVACQNELEYMLDAALQRRHLDPSQKAALIVERDHYQQARAQAAQRSRANLNNSPEVAKLPPRGKTRDLAARQGCSARTIQDVATVHQHDPELFQQIKEGRLAANVAARRVRRTRRDAQLPEAGPMPDGLFELVYADPPWQLGNPDGAHAPENHYKTRPLQEIKEEQPPVTKNAVLFLWAVPCLFPEALEVMAPWGFTYTGQIVWVKPSIGLGNWVRYQHELLLIGRKGSWPCPQPEDRVPSVIQAPRGRHSQKPELFYELIERMYPQASKLELYARGTPRPGWAAWGNEVSPP
jgi:N6-adenosine-specific RNA methylase IME4